MVGIGRYEQRQAENAELSGRTSSTLTSNGPLATTASCTEFTIASCVSLYGPSCQKTWLKDVDVRRAPGNPNCGGLKGRVLERAKLH